MEDIRVALGNRIKKLRQGLKISQEALAYRADLDRTYIASIEKGRRNVSIVNIERIALALNCTLSSFFDADEFRERVPDDYMKVAEEDKTYN